MRILLGVLTVIICVLIAYKLSLKYTERRKFFVSLNDFNEKMKNEVSYGKKTVIGIIVEMNKNDDTFYKYVSSYFKGGIEYSLNKKVYSIEEVEFMGTYVNQIGVTDSQTQLKYLQSVGQSISTRAAVAIENEKKYKPLYIKLGFLLGLLVLVVII